MKKTILFSFLPLMAIFLFIAAYEPASVPDDQDWPEEVMTVLENSCFDCHSSESGNVKAKTKLNFSKWADLKVTKQVGKLDGIREALEKGDMPPQKYLNKYPDKALTEEQVKLITDWANDEMDKLMGE